MKIISQYVLHYFLELIVFFQPWIAFELRVIAPNILASPFCSFQDGLNDLQDVENSLASFRIHPLQGLKYACAFLNSIYYVDRLNYLILKFNIFPSKLLHVVLLMLLFGFLVIGISGSVSYINKMRRNGHLKLM